MKVEAGVSHFHDLGAEGEDKWGECQLTGAEVQNQILISSDLSLTEQCNWPEEITDVEVPLENNPVLFPKDHDFAAVPCTLTSNHNLEFAWPPRGPSGQVRQGRSYRIDQR